MVELISLPLSRAVLAGYGGGEGLRREVGSLGCQGIEGIWAGEDLSEELPPGLVPGYHLTFFPDWLDFFREDRTALLRKYGSLEAVRSFYGGWGADCLLALYRADLDRARSLGARYVVFHVSDVSVEEGYTYRWLHTDREVIDASAQIVNALLEDGDSFDFLMENQWWPGLTLTDPEETSHLLEDVRYPRKGLLLDTGHLMNTDPSLGSEEEGVAYLHRMLDRHGVLCRYIRGIHLHQSLSGGYVRAHTGALPPDLPEDSVERFGVSYGHILRIDQHRPWTSPRIRTVVDRLRPPYLTHELAADGPEDRRAAVLRQRRTLWGGGPGQDGAK